MKEHERKTRDQWALIHLQTDAMAGLGCVRATRALQTIAEKEGMPFKFDKGYVYRTRVNNGLQQSKRRIEIETSNFSFSQQWLCKRIP